MSFDVVFARTCVVRGRARGWFMRSCLGVGFQQPDNAAGLLMYQEKVDVVLFGADRVTANGDVANKVGTMKLAVCAKEFGVPVYAVVPTSTIDLTLASGKQIPIEERSAREVHMAWVVGCLLVAVPPPFQSVLPYPVSFVCTVPCQRRSPMWVTPTWPRMACLCSIRVLM